MTRQHLDAFNHFTSLFFSSMSSPYVHKHTNLQSLYYVHNAISRCLGTLPELPRRTTHVHYEHLLATFLWTDAVQEVDHASPGFARSSVISNHSTVVSTQHSSFLLAKCIVELCCLSTPPDDGDDGGGGGDDESTKQSVLVTSD